MYLIFWEYEELVGWDIVGMNHYYVDGERRLFVAMTRNGFCIKAEGADQQGIFDDLLIQARRHNKPTSRY